jgi:hypothetical protein
MPTVNEALADWRSAAARALSTYGEMVEVREGTLTRDAGPITTAAAFAMRGSNP